VGNLENIPRKLVEAGCPNTLVPKQKCFSWVPFWFGPYYVIFGSGLGRTGPDPELFILAHQRGLLVENE
jgi:hypothetical protein